MKRTVAIALLGACVLCGYAQRSNNNGRAVTPRQQTTASKPKQNAAVKHSTRSKPAATKPTQSESYPQELRTETFTVNGVTFNMIRVEGGTFTMGATAEQQSPGDDEKPTHRVTLSSYMIGKTEVTQELWQAVMGKSLQQIVNENGWSTYGVGNNYPMYDISWNDCQDFVRKLNALTGQSFRLPTEAEWEFAARGGTKSKGYQYSGSNTLGDVAWYTDNSGSKTHPVATKSPNELGIYDMSGNVWEWCQDWHGSYSSSAQTNPQGPSSGYSRVFRGGCWANFARGCRSADRYFYDPADSTCKLGLRLAL